MGGRRNVEVGHVNGHEEDNSARNKIWTCRACNVLTGNVLRGAGLGRLTRQYNPARGARTWRDWMTATGVMRGDFNDMPVRSAVAMIQATPAGDRAAFAQQIQPIKRNPPAAEGVPTFEQYAWAVAHHYRPYIKGVGWGPGAHDEGGAIIHATPKRKRREYADDIAAGKGARRMSEVPF